MDKGVFTQGIKRQGVAVNTKLSLVLRLSGTS